jgi:hypothetical protein
VIPLDEMTRYAVVITDRLVDGKGNAVKSPFDFVYHASMEPTAARVREIVNDPKLAEYFGPSQAEGGLAGTGLDHVAFTWSFTTQPTVDDMKRLRDGLYGQGPFARWGTQYPPRFELQRAVGLSTGIDSGTTEHARLEDQPRGAKGRLRAQAPEPLRHHLRRHPRQDEGPARRRASASTTAPARQLLLKVFDHIDRMVVGTYKTPFLLEGGPEERRPQRRLPHLNYVTGETRRPPTRCSSG